jgi:hypothetical protein
MSLLNLEKTRRLDENTKEIEEKFLRFLDHIHAANIPKEDQVFLFFHLLDIETLFQKTYRSKGQLLTFIADDNSFETSATTYKRNTADTKQSLNLQMSKNLLPTTSLYICLKFLEEMPDTPLPTNFIEDKNKDFEGYIQRFGSTLFPLHWTSPYNNRCLAAIVFENI